MEINASPSKPAQTPKAARQRIKIAASASAATLLLVWLAVRLGAPPSAQAAAPPAPAQDCPQARFEPGGGQTRLRLVAWNPPPGHRHRYGLAISLDGQRLALNESDNAEADYQITLENGVLILVSAAEELPALGSYRLAPDDAKDAGFEAEPDKQGFFDAAAHPPAWVGLPAVPPGAKLCWTKW